MAKRGLSMKQSRSTAASSCASSLPRDAGVRKALPPSERWVDVLVNRRNVPVPKQALYAAASDLRLATEGHVDLADCAAAVALALSAIERHWGLPVVRICIHTPLEEIESTTRHRRNNVPARQGIARQ